VPPRHHKQQPAPTDQDQLLSPSAGTLPPRGHPECLRTFEELEQAGVDLTGIVLKPNFVTPGLDATPVSAPTVAAATFSVLRETVPSAVPGIAFLSGGHPTADVCEFLRELSTIRERPWQLTFSFGRALVSAALHIWGGDAVNVPAAQTALLDNCRRAGAATTGVAR
jgi:fructose-bisphosphate aldolase, class I